MTKRFKILIILSICIALIAAWTAFSITHTKNQTANNWWQAALGSLAVVGGGLGMLTSKHWSWLKSGVGRGVFLLSAGLALWGIGQIAWTYVLAKQSSLSVPLNGSVDILVYLYILTLPFIIYGMLKLSEATGAKYIFKKRGAKVMVAIWSLVMIAVTFFVLLGVSGVGTSYFSSVSLSKTVFDLGFPIFDAINLVVAVSIVGLSWKLIGGLFKIPIIMLAIGFVMLFISDLTFSYYEVTNKYYNGHWSDLLYVLTFAIFSIALCSLDPTKNLKTVKSRI